MGVRNWLRNHRMTDPVVGTYQLTGCSMGSSDATYANCRMTGVVTGPGVGPVVVEHRCMVPTSKWPVPGQALPVTVDRADPTRLRINWADVASGLDQARQAAAQLAAAFAAEMPQPTVLGDPGRAVPGTAGGGLTPEQAQAAIRDGGADLGLQQGSARVLAVYEIPIPPGMPGAPPAGLCDLTLDVTTVGGHHYGTRMRMGFGTPERRASVAAVGTVLPVLADPVQRDRIVVDTNRMS